MRSQFVKSISKIFKQNKKVNLITGDLGFGYFKEFYEKKCEQFLNIGVWEQNMASVAAGMSMINNNVVYIYSIGNFATLRCLEQIRQDICYHNLNVNVVSMGAGFSYGSLGGSHHLLEDISVMRSIPNMKVFLPSDERDIDEILKLTSKGIGPTYMRIDKSKVLNNIIPKTNVLKPREICDGKDGYIISTGGILNDVLDCIKTLKSNYQINLGLILLSYINYDEYKIFKKKIKKNMNIFTVEEHSLVGGIGDYCLDIFNKRNIKYKNFNKIGVSNKSFSKVSGSQNFLKKINKIDSLGIMKVIKKTFCV